MSGEAESVKMDDNRGFEEEEIILRWDRGS